ncbi:hypothetical protein ACHQM5_029952 [Ranunculus cassubicifolius]
MPVVPDIPVKGTVWPTIQECRAWLRDYAVNTNMEYRYQKNDPDRIRAVCWTYWNGGECPWYFSSGVNTGVRGDKTTCKCHTFNPQHGEDCFAPEEFVNSMIDAQWVAQKMEAEVRVHYQTFKAREIIRAVWAKYAHHISYYTAWHARCKIMEKIHARAYRKSDQIYWMDKIKEKSSECYDWLVARNEDTFCREKPVATLVEDLVIMMMAMMRKRQIKAQSMDPNGIVPRARKVIDKHLKKIQDYTYSSAEVNKFLVLSYTGARWLVDLGAKTFIAFFWMFFEQVWHVKLCYVILDFKYLFGLLGFLLGVE